MDINGDEMIVMIMMTGITIMMEDNDGDEMIAIIGIIMMIWG